MAARQCPYCTASVSAAAIAAKSDSLVCPGCGRPLEVSPLSRSISISAGLICATVAAAGARWAFQDEVLGWTLPLVFAVLAFGLVSPVVLMLSASLRLNAEAGRDEDSSRAPEPAVGRASHS